jgi:Bacterial Ig domain
MRRFAFLTTIVVLIVIIAPPASATPPKLSPSGQLDFVYGASPESSGGTATGQKPESKLFYTGGSGEPVRWWGVFGTSGAQASSDGIWLWELVDHRWVARFELAGADVWMKADVLFDGSTAYVALRDNGPAPRQSLLYRLPYTGNGTWGATLGPTVITTQNPETLSIARDSVGRLWVSYENGQKIRAGFTAPGGTSFTYFDLVAPNVSSDDISTITAFGGDRIGIAWSNQSTRQFSFAWRNDSAPSTAASFTTETAYGAGVGDCPTANGTACADDHLNIQVVGSEVYIVVKTSLNDQSGTSTDPLNVVLRRSSGGSWQAFRVNQVFQDATRPILVLNPSQNAMYVFANRAKGVDVWESSFASPSFTPTQFSTWVRTPTGSANDPTATKQPTTSASGTVVLTSVNSTNTYFHNEYLGDGVPPPNTVPTATGTTATTESGVPVGIQLTGHDAETCELGFSIASGPSHGSLGPISGAPCASGSPHTDTASVTYTPAAGYTGPDSFTFSVSDGVGDSTPATVSVTVSPAQDDPPTALAGTASTDVDTTVGIPMTGTDPDTCDLTFAISSPPAHGSLGGILDSDCVAGSPNTDTASVNYTPAAGYVGSDSFSFTVSDGTTTSAPATISIMVSEPGAGIGFRSASSGSNTRATTLELPAPPSLAQGDVMIAVVAVRGTPSITPPPGWALVRMDGIPTTMRQAVYVHVAATSEPQQYTWTFGATQSAVGAILAYSGVDQVTPVDVHNGAVNDVAGSQVRAPSITTTGLDEMVIGFFGITQNRTFTPAGGMTERTDVMFAGAQYPISSATADVLQGTAGATGDKVAVASGTGKSVGQLLALRPAP